MPQLPADCLNEIFEYLEEDKFTLYSCLLVNRLWCEVSVRILWRNIYSYYARHRTSAYETLFSCLPIESKEILYRNGIIIPTPTSKSPIFNYAAFCEVLVVGQVDSEIRQFLTRQQQNLKNKNMIEKEIFKLYMNQISSLKTLDLYSCSINIQNIMFTSYPGAKDCLKGLSKLYCCSNTYPEFFNQLSKICHNIKSLYISFSSPFRFRAVRVIPNGLTDLISAQKDLKYLTLEHLDNHGNLLDIIPSLTKCSNTLIKFELTLNGKYIPLSFIAGFTNLQELALAFCNVHSFEDFEKLQHVTFPRLQILNFRYTCPRRELLTIFLENNGTNLKEFYVDDGSTSLNLAIARFCPGLRKLSIGFKNNELESLKMVFNSCQHLESIKIWCDHCLNEKEVLEMVAKYSPKNFYELILYYLDNVQSKLLPEELESFFVSWMNHKQKTLSLTIISYNASSLDTNYENMKVIGKYVQLGVIRFKGKDSAYH